MKQLRKTLALVLALVMLISVVPFSVHAEEADAKFSVAKVNGKDYDSTTPIVSGDTITVALTLTIGEGEQIKAWMLGYHFDSAALTYGGTVFDDTVWNGTTADKTSYVLIGASIKPSASVSGTEIVVANINFTANASFTASSSAPFRRILRKSTVSA